MCAENRPRLRFGSAPPFSELFPGLHEFLNCARRRNLAVYDLTIAVGALINFAYGVLAQESEVPSHFRQVFPAEELLISGIGTACHGWDRSIFALYSPYMFSPGFPRLCPGLKN